MEPEGKFSPRWLEYDGFKLYIGSFRHLPENAVPWVRQFCSQRKNNWYVVVDIGYLEDNFNFFGLHKYIPNFNLACQMIRDRHAKEWEYMSDEDAIEIHEQAKQLYGLIHARYLCTSLGMDALKRKVIDKRRYGVCPRHFCQQCPLLPVGTSPIPNRHSAKLFCLRCADIYTPPDDNKVDGAHFGPAVPAVFLTTFPEYDGRHRFSNPQQRIFGFKLYNDASQTGPHSTVTHDDDSSS